MIYALGEERGANIELSLVSWCAAMEGLGNGTYGELTGVTYSEMRATSILFSTQTISDPYVTFGRSTDETGNKSERCV